MTERQILARILELADQAIGARQKIDDRKNQMEALVEEIREDDGELDELPEHLEAMNEAAIGFDVAIDNLVRLVSGYRDTLNNS